jgi:hypothetical protein
MWDSFIDGFCKVEFLCYAGDPNWLGWIVLLFGGLVALVAAFLALAIAIAIGSLINDWLNDDDDMRSGHT